MKPDIENLKAWMSGRITTGYQRALAMREFEQLLTYVAELEQLSQPLVSGSVCEHLHQKWEGEYPHNCKKVCQVCREVLAN